MLTVEAVRLSADNESQWEAFVTEYLRLMYKDVVGTYGALRDRVQGKGIEVEVYESEAPS